MEKLNNVTLSLGSNIEDRVFHLKTALQKIEAKVGRILHKSSIYESESLGFTSDIPFYNICIEIETKLSPNLLLYTTQQIEIEIGRKTKTSKLYESRKIDIDIIFYSKEIIENETLSIPHKKFMDRKFVLVPLYELSPLVSEPINGNTMTELLAKCKDKSEVKRTSIVI